MFAQRRAQAQLQGIFDEMISIGREFVGDDFNVSDQCLTRATNDVSRFDADIKDVEDNWKPTNFYTPDQLREIVVFGGQAFSAVMDGFLQASRQPQLESHRELLMEAFTKLNQEASGRLSMQPFQTALNQAAAAAPTTNKPVVIESTGLKRWVVEVLKVCRQGRFVLAAIDCARPAVILSVLNAIRNAADSFIDFVKTVAGVALDIVKKTTSLVIAIPDFLSTLLKAGKIAIWVAIFGGAYFVATKTVLPPRFDPLRLRERPMLAPWRKGAGAGNDAG